MRRRIRGLALVVATALLLGGCGTPLYEITDEEEDLIVQGAAYMLSKHNIYQKDGVNGSLPEKKKNPPGTAEPDTQSPPDEGGSQTGLTGGGQDAAVQGGGMSLAEAIGYKDRLEVSYNGFSLMDVYQEENYFSLKAAEGNTFVVMSFTISNPEAEALNVSNFDAGYEFFLSYEGASHIPEKQSIIADSLAAFEGEIPANGSAGAVLVFEIKKDSAELVVTPKLTMEHENTAYFVSL